MRFKLQFLGFLLISILITAVILRSFPRLDLRIEYERRVGGPFRGMILKGLKIISRSDTITARQAFLLIRSLNPFEFELNLSGTKLKFLPGGGKEPGFWFIPIRVQGDIHLLSGSVILARDSITDLDLDLRMQGFGPNLSGSIDRIQFCYRQKKFQAGGEVILTPGGVEIKKGRVTTGGLDLLLSGLIIRGRGGFEVSGRLDLDRFTSYPGQLHLSGRIDWDRGRIGSNLTGTLTNFLRPETIPVIISSLGDSIRIVFPEVRSEPGFASGWAVWKKGELDAFAIELDRFQLNRYLPINLILTGRLTRRAGRLSGRFQSLPLGIDSILVAGRLDSLSISIYSIDGQAMWMGRPDSFLFSLHNFPINPLLTPFGLGGEGRVTGVIKREGSIIAGELTGQSIRSHGLRGDQIRAVFPSFSLTDYSGSGEVEILGLGIGKEGVDHLTLRYEDRRITASSGERIQIELTLRKDRLEITRLNLNTGRFTLTALKPFEIQLRPEVKIETLCLFLNDGLIKGSIRLGPEPTFDLSGSRIDLSHLLPELSGRIDFDARGDSIRYQIKKLVFHGERFGDIQGRLDTKGRLAGKGDGFRFRGNLLPSPSLWIELRDFPLERFWFLGDYLEARGLVAGKVRFQKGWRGVVRVESDEAIIKATRSRIRDLKAQVALEGNRILFRSIEGRTERGRVKGEGWLALKGSRVDTIHLGIEFSRTYISLPNIHGYASGTIMIDGGERIRIKGGIDAGEAIYSYSLTGGGVTRSKDDKLDLDLSLRFDRGIMLKGDLLNSELEGELRVIRRRGILSLSGEFQSNRGEIRYLDHNLRLEYANATFINDPEINPLIDLKATMNSRLGYRIILRVTGRLREPIFNFYSDPPGLSEQDIITYLNTGFTWTEIQEMGSEDRISSLLSERLIRLLTYSLSRELRGISGLDYLDIEKSQLTIGKYLRPNLFFSYTHNLGSFSSDAFELDYTIRPRERIVLEKLQEGEYSIQYKIRLRF